MISLGFNGIIGQNSAKIFLISAIKNGTLNHAFIFEGAKGLGKKTLAAALAKVLVCEDGKNDACGVCKGCMMADTGSHPDIIRLACAVDKRSIGVDEIRGIVTEAYLKPYYSEKKVFIVEDADTMTEQAQNAILKIFEEPPLYAVFILLANNSRLLLETVRSRGMLFSLSPYSDSEVKTALQERVPALYDRFDFLVAYSHNNIGRALELASDEVFNSLRQEATGIITQMLCGNGKAACTLAQLFEKQKTFSDKLFEIIISILRDIVFICLDCHSLVVNRDISQSLELSAQKLSPQKALSSLEMAIEANQRIMRNVNYNLSVMTWLFANWEDIND